MITGLLPGDVGHIEFVATLLLVAFAPFLTDGAFQVVQVDRFAEGLLDLAFLEGVADGTSSYDAGKGCALGLGKKLHPGKSLTLKRSSYARGDRENG
jgi:hypothetical protein